MQKKLLLMVTSELYSKLMVTAEVYSKSMVKPDFTDFCVHRIYVSQRVKFNSYLKYLPNWIK